MNRYPRVDVTEFRDDGIVSEGHDVVQLRPHDDETRVKGHAGQQLFVDIDVGVRPAPDEEGEEHHEETEAAPREVPPPEIAPQQEQQQQ